MTKKTSALATEKERQISAQISKLRMAVSRHEYSSIEDICKEIIKTSKLLAAANRPLTK